MLVPEIALTPAVAVALPRRRSASASPSSTAASRTASATISGSGSAAARSTSSSARGRPCSRRSSSVGLIVVDEEHDGSYKQEESPRYNGRDVAIVRGQRAAALVVLGSATPSMESYHNAMAGKYERIVLERRVLDRPLAVGDGRRHARGVRGGRART